MSTESQSDSNPGFFEKYRGLVIGTIGVLVVALVGGLIWYGFASYRQGVRNDGVGQQRNVLTLERQFEIGLSNCLDKSNIAGQIARQEYASIKDILTDVVSARYVDDNGNATRASSTLGGGAFISSLHEQYPQIDLSTWKKFMDTALGCRDDVSDLQSRLQGYAGTFDTWTQTGGVFTKSIHAEFPTIALKAYNAKEHRDVFGREALDYLTRVIKTKEAADAIDSGTMPDQNLTGSTPAPAPSTTPSR
jgi:hypothetical protein